MDLRKTTTQKAFGELVGISQPAVSDLLKAGVLVDGESAGKWLLAYCARLREQAAGRAGADGSLDLVGERARVAKEQADKLAMQNAVTRGELAPVVFIEEVLAKTAGKINGILDALPGMLRRRVDKLSSEDIDMVAEEIAKVRNTVAAMNLAQLYEAPQPDDSDVRVDV